MPSYAYFHKKIVPIEEAKIGIMTHALHYGTGVFEGIRGNWNEEKKQMFLFRPKDHYDRLHQSCKILKIGLPYTSEELTRITVELVEKCGFREDIYVRPVAYKSSHVVGVRLHDLEDDFFAFVTPFGPYLDITKGIKCGTSTWRRIDDTMIPPRAKITGLYVNSAIAKTEAHDNGYDEAILLTYDGHVSEGSGEDIFLIMKGKLVTPATSDNILEGITRETVIILAKEELGLETVERSVDRSELYLADECFMTGTAAHVTPVIEVDHRKVGSGEIGKITLTLQNLYFDVVRGRVKKYADWLLPLHSRIKA